MVLQLEGSGMRSRREIYARVIGQGKDARQVDTAATEADRRVPGDLTGCARVLGVAGLIVLGTACTYWLLVGLMALSDLTGWSAGWTGAAGVGLFAAGLAVVFRK